MSGWREGRKERERERKGRQLKGPTGTRANDILFKVMKINFKVSESTF